MRSTPIILDRLRHIKYDLQAVWDMDYLMGGEFRHIPDKEITFALVRFLLWSGLISEDPALTMEDTGRLMTEADAADSKKLQDISLVCINELFESGWLYRPGTDAEPDGEPPVTAPTVREHIGNLIRLAHQAGMTDTGQVWKHTPVEIEEFARAVSDRAQEEREAADYRMGMTCAVIMDAHNRVKKGGGRFAWSDFIPRAAKPQTADEMKDIILAANAALGGNTI
jgi:hypothetical protein